MVQYAAKLGFTQSEMATIGSLGFVLSSIVAIPLGKLGDSLEAPAVLLLFGGAACFLGYFGLGGTYLGLLPNIHVGMSAFYVAIGGQCFILAPRSF